MTDRFKTPLNAETLVAANIFVGHIADRFRERTARRVFGFRRATMSRQEAMELALPCFDVAIADDPFGGDAYAWDRAHAHELVDEELSYWEP